MGGPSRDGHVPNLEQLHPVRQPEVLNVLLHPLQRSRVSCHSAYAKSGAEVTPRLAEGNTLRKLVKIFLNYFTARCNVIGLIHFAGSESCADVTRSSKKIQTLHGLTHYVDDSINCCREWIM